MRKKRRTEVALRFMCNGSRDQGASIACIHAYTEILSCWCDKLQIIKYIQNHPKYIHFRNKMVKQNSTWPGFSVSLTPPQSSLHTFEYSSTAPSQCAM